MGAAQASQQAFTRVTPSTVNHSTALRSALKQAPVTQVLAQRQVAKGVVVRAVKDAQGRIYKQVVRNGVPSPAPESRVSRRAGDSSSSFYEGFEGWDGQAQDWIPSGWT